MRFFNFLAVSAVAMLSTVNADAWNNNKHNATEAQAQCNSCCSSSGSADDSACKITSQVNGVPVTSPIQCCGVIGNSAFCCPTLADGETSCKYVNIPFFQKYTCGGSSSSSSSSATVAPTPASSSSSKPWSDNSDNSWSPATPSVDSSVPSSTESTSSPSTDSSSTPAPSSTDSSSSSDATWNKSQKSSMQQLDDSVTPAPASGQNLDANGNNNQSSASSTLAWWIWFLISIGILLFVICVVMSILRCCLDVTCSIL